MLANRNANYGALGETGPVHQNMRIDAGDARIFAESHKMREVLAQVEMVAATDCPVLLQGETGVGKEVIAAMIHERSMRGDHALVKVNCAAIPSGLLESELFGHERGAFTGAMAQRIGRFEMADKGTLFLDEVGDMSTEVQPKLGQYLLHTPIFVIGWCDA